MHLLLLCWRSPTEQHRSLREAASTVGSDKVQQGDASQWSQYEVARVIAAVTQAEKGD